jgi:hypothetical protein
MGAARLQTKGGDIARGPGSERPSLASGSIGATPAALSDRALRFLTFAGTAVMVAIVAMHFGLLNRGAWGGDDYTTFGAYRLGGLHYGWFRFWSWSPRPLAELLYGLYGAAAIVSRRPFIVPLLFLGWIAFLACAIPTLLHRNRDGMASHVLGTTALLAFVVLGQDVFWVFYWPLAILAYMPVIATALFLLFSLVNENPQPQLESAGIGTTLVLIAAAWSSESGTLVVLVFSGIAIVYQLIRDQTDAPRLRIVARWIPPIAAGMLVVAFSLFNHRTADPIFPGGDTAVYHHTLASLCAAAARLPLELFSPAGEPSGHFVLGLTVRALFFAGIYCCWVTRDPAARRDRHWLPVLALALLMAMFLELAATYRQFGAAFDIHHVEVRYGLGLVILAALAIWLPPPPRLSVRIVRAAAPVLLVAATVPLLLPRYKDLVLDYKFYWEPGRLRAMTWQSGFSPGPAMTIYQPVPDSVFWPMIPPGHHVAEDGWWASGVLNFFGKKSVDVIIFADHRASE